MLRRWIVWARLCQQMKPGRNEEKCGPEGDTQDIYMGDVQAIAQEIGWWVGLIAQIDYGTLQSWR